MSGMFDRFARRSQDDWLMAMRFSMRQPSSHLILRNVTDSSTPKQIMDELRRDHPEEAMLLGEWIVTEDDEDAGAGAP